MGKGYGTEAAKAVIEFVFKEKNYHRVYARYLKSNPASGKIMEKCGMTYEGTLKIMFIKTILSRILFIMELLIR